MAADLKYQRWWWVSFGCTADDPMVFIVSGDDPTEIIRTAVSLGAPPPGTAEKPTEALVSEVDISAYPASFRNHKLSRTEAMEWGEYTKAGSPIHGRMRRIHRPGEVE